MVRHVVLFKFKPEVDNAARTEFIDMLKQLAVDIEQVRSLEVGENFTESPRAFDVCLIVDVDDEAALKAYAQHPDHQPVLQRVGEIMSGSHVVDYAIN